MGGRLICPFCGRNGLGMLTNLCQGSGVGDSSDRSPVESLGTRSKVLVPRRASAQPRYFFVLILVGETRESLGLFP